MNSRPGRTPSWIHRSPLPGSNLATERPRLQGPRSPAIAALHRRRLLGLKGAALSPKSIENISDANLCDQIYLMRDSFAFCAIPSSVSVQNQASTALRPPRCGHQRERPGPGPQKNMGRNGGRHGKSLEAFWIFHIRDPVLSREIEVGPSFGVQALGEGLLQNGQSIARVEEGCEVQPQ